LAAKKRQRFFDYDLYLVFAFRPSASRVYARPRWMYI
jgi:hypothetical protein